MPGIPLRVTKIEQSLGFHSEPFLGRKNNLQFRSMEHANSRKFPSEAFADFCGTDKLEFCRNEIPLPTLGSTIDQLNFLLLNRLVITNRGRNRNLI
jgi:hypothetical protein